MLKLYGSGHCYYMELYSIYFMPSFILFSFSFSFLSFSQIIYRMENSLAIKHSKGITSQSPVDPINHRVIIGSIGESSPTFHRGFITRCSCRVGRGQSFEKKL
jgi:hypothetical protein